MQLPTSLPKLVGLFSLLIVSLVSLALGLYGEVNVLVLFLGIIGLILWAIILFLPKTRQVVTIFKFMVETSFIVLYIGLAIYYATSYLGVIAIVLLLISLLSVLS